MRNMLRPDFVSGITLQQSRMLPWILIFLCVNFDIHAAAYAADDIKGSANVDDSVRHRKSEIFPSYLEEFNEKFQKNSKLSEVDEELHELPKDNWLMSARKDIELAALLRQQLIYKFAIDLKQITRITYFTCRKPAIYNTKSNANSKANSSGNSSGNSKGNNYESNQQNVMNNMHIEYFNELYHMQHSLKLLQRLHVPSSIVNAKVVAQCNAATASVTGNDNKGNVTGNSLKGNKTNATTTNVTTTNKTTTKTTTTATATATAQEAPAASGRAATPTTPTTTTANKNINSNSNSNSNGTASATTAESSTTHYGGLSIKLLHIDHLIKPKVNKNYYNSNNKNNKNYFQRGRNADNGPTRNTYTNTVWLEDALRPDVLRQIVVLDLSCGNASRRLLELASNKMYFNAAYHWLLIEDYAFERQQTKIDDGNNNIVNGNNNNNNNNNKSNENNTDSAVLPQSQSTNVRQQQAPANITMPSTRIIKATTTPPPRLTSTASEQAEQDVEPIEKFLEKLNIYANSELILAKRIRGYAAAAAAATSGTDADKADKAVNDGVFVAAQESNYYKLYDIWSPGYQFGGTLNTSFIGNFTHANGFELAPWYRSATTVRRRMNLQLARVRCLIVITNKNVTGTLEHYITTAYDTHLDSMNRFNYALLAEVRDMFNMSFILSKTATWGYLKNGKFDGMIGALVRQQADIGGSPIFFRLERAKVIDYTTRTWTSRPCFIFRHPRSTKKDRIVFLQPFSNAVWIVLALSGTVTVLLLWLLTTLERLLLPDPNYQMFSGKGGAAAAAAAAKATITQHQQQQRERTNGRVSVAMATGSSHINYCNSSSRNGSGSGSGGMNDGNYNFNSSAICGSTLEQRCESIAKVARANSHSKGNDNNNSVEGVGAGGDAGAGAGGQKNFRQPRIHWRYILFGRDSNDASKQRRVGLFLESVLFYIGLICQQGLSFSTNLISGRCIVVISLLFAFSIYQFYSASIVGTLLMEKPKTIRTLADLTHSLLEIGVEDIVYNRDYFLRTKDPDAMELYAKKVTSVPVKEDQGYLETPPDALGKVPQMPPTVLTAAAKEKSYREILHSHETGAHAKTNEASNWYDPDYGMTKVQQGKFAFHVDVATAYKIIADRFEEREICDLTEIQLFPPQKCVGIVQKGSPLRKIITYGLRRTAEVGVMDYQFKIWHSPKPRCNKQIHTDDLQVDLETFASALLVLAFGYLLSLTILGLEIAHYKLRQHVIKNIESPLQSEDVLN